LASRYDRVLAASKGGGDASGAGILSSDAVDVDSAMIESWAKDNAGDWLVMVYLDEDWNCVEYAPAWESVVDGLQVCFIDNSQ
jgi:hypothetical protein